MANHRPRHAIGKHRRPSNTLHRIYRWLKPKTLATCDTLVLPRITT